MSDSTYVHTQKYIYIYITRTYSRYRWFGLHQGEGKNSEKREKKGIEPRRVNAQLHHGQLMRL